MKIQFNHKELFKIFNVYQWVRLVSNIILEMIYTFIAKYTLKLDTKIRKTLNRCNFEDGKFRTTSERSLQVRNLVF